MNFKLAAFLLLASYSLATPRMPHHRTLLDSDHAVLVRRAPDANTPTPISPALLETFHRNVFYAGASSCDNLKPWICPACKQALVKNTEVVSEFSNTLSAAHGYVAVNHEQKQIIVSFRGSKDAFSYIEDIKVLFKTGFAIAGRGAKVHRGFYNVYNAAKPLIHDPVNQLLAKYPDYYLNVVGHSLGAGVASLTALDLAVANPNRKVVLVGVSQPRVGNKAFALAIANQKNLVPFRLEQANDFVGQYPKPIFGFVHSSPEYWINPAFSETVVYCPSAPGEESQLCSNSVPRKFSSEVHNLVFGYNFAGGCDASS